MGCGNSEDGGEIIEKGGGGDVNEDVLDKLDQAMEYNEKIQEGCKKASEFCKKNAGTVKEARRTNSDR